MTKFSCLYGNINLAELANVITTHAGLRELDIGIYSQFDPQLQEPDSREFEDFHHIAEAMKGNQQVIKIGAHSRNLWRVYFYLSRNRLNLTQVDRFNQSCFVTLFRRVSQSGDGWKS
jgi:lauroyl/myristoyl acyltransferase